MEVVEDLALPTGDRVCSYQAEGTAIVEGSCMTLRRVIGDRMSQGKKPKVLLATDSQSNIKKLDSCKPSTGEEVQMFYAVGMLAQAVDLSIQHVRGHAKISVNEYADRLADSGSLAQLMISGDKNNLGRSVTHEAVKDEVRGKIGKRSENNLRRSMEKDSTLGKYNWYKMATANLTKFKLKNDVALCRSIQTATCQLQCGLMPCSIGFKYQHNTGRCNKCDKKIPWEEGASHVIFDCPLVEEVRKLTVGEHCLDKADPESIERVVTRLFRKANNDLRPIDEFVIGLYHGFGGEDDGEESEDDLMAE